MHKWRYVINLCGKELPLVTTRELAKRLSKLNGSSSIRAGLCKESEELSRIRYPVTYNRHKTDYVVHRDRRLGSPPFDVKTQYYKSEAYVMVSYDFAKYLTTDATALRVHRFFKECKNPEEHFYATMFRWPRAPGGYDPALAQADSYYSTESVFWTFGGRRCRGKEVHNVCIAALGDLHEILTRLKWPATHMFHNKYFLEEDHAVMDCMEAALVRRNQEEFLEECTGGGH